MNRVTKTAAYLLLLLTMWGGQVWAASNSSQAAGSAAVSPSGVQVSSDNKTTLFLSGVVIYGEKRSALFEIERGNQTTKRQVKEGEKIGGYTLDKVEKDRVVLKHDGEIRVLLLKHGRIEMVFSAKERKEEKRDGVKEGNDHSFEEEESEEFRERAAQGIMKVIKMFPNHAGMNEAE